jgi:hypothetical protein
MRVIHQHSGPLNYNGVTYLNPTWRTERLVFDYNVDTVVVSVFITDGSRVDLIDLDLRLHAITEQNVILAIENWLEGNA